jgi:hypothetical protein
MMAPVKKVQAGGSLRAMTEGRVVSCIAKKCENGSHGGPCGRAHDCALAIYDFPAMQLNCDKHQYAWKAAGMIKCDKCY